MKLKFPELLNYIKSEMIMQENYQPIVLRKILLFKSATKEELEEELKKYNSESQSQSMINTVLRVLQRERNNMIRKEGKKFVINSSHELSSVETKELVDACNKRIEEFENIKHTSNTKRKRALYVTNNFPLMLKEFQNIVISKGKAFYKIGNWNPVSLSSSDYPLHMYLQSKGNVVAMFTVSNILNSGEFNEIENRMSYRVTQKSDYMDSPTSAFLELIETNILDNPFSINHLEQYNNKKKVDHHPQRVVYVVDIGIPGFPFEVNGFYEKQEIRSKLKVSAYGGIRYNKHGNFLVLFTNAPDSRTTQDKFRNIYHDEYDIFTNTIYYTGEGQEGNQKLQRGNLLLSDAEKNRTVVHYFRQNSIGESHEYLGKVKVVNVEPGIQKDASGKNRNVFIFSLKPISDSIISDETSSERETQFHADLLIQSGRSPDELLVQARKLNEQIKKSGPKKGMVYQKKQQIEEKRNQIMKKYMKSIHYTECQVCGVPHFKTSKSHYCEVHHLIPWNTTHDDSIVNLVVVCPTCHRKFDYGAKEVKISLYEKLISRFPKINYNKPSYIQ